MASNVWGQVGSPPSTILNLDDIMSEEVARDLQDKKNKKKQLAKAKKVLLNDRSDVTTTTTDTPSTSTSQSQYDEIPAEVLKFLKDDNPDADSDDLIAQVLQAQFDLEFDEQVKREERHRNKESKVSVSLSKFRMYPDDLLYESDEEEKNKLTNLNGKKNWDRFDTNEKEYSNIGRCGYKLDEEGGIKTKHDPTISGRRNACKVMSFPPEFSTGDGASFDMKLSNTVFNQLRSHAKRVNSRKTNKAQDRRENIATAEMGLDEPTRLLLYKMINNQLLQSIDGIISTGKEAIILHADTDPNYPERSDLPKEVAIKVFSTTLNEFKQRDRYIKDDYRFKDRFSKQNARTVINMWAEKELHNLSRIRKCDISCPDIILLKKNILVMSFIGENCMAAPKLKDAKLTAEELDYAYKEIVVVMKKLYEEAKLVHADLSEYNILWYENKCFIIDVAQAVEIIHPGALEFLMRDCYNISNVR